MLDVVRAMCCSLLQGLRLRQPLPPSHSERPTRCEEAIHEPHQKHIHRGYLDFIKDAKPFHQRNGFNKHEGDSESLDGCFAYLVSPSRTSSFYGWLSHIPRSSFEEYTGMCRAVSEHDIHQQGLVADAWPAMRIVGLQSSVSMKRQQKKEEDQTAYDHSYEAWLNLCVL